jgi:hypothetical protein
MRDAMTIRATTPDSCNPRNDNRAHAYRPAISWRKLLILQRSALSRAWDIAFPQHDFGTGRLRQYSPNSFERSCSRAEADRARGGYRPVPARETPEVTVEAILHCVRERGLPALKEPVNIERLLRCDEAAKEQIDERIAKLIAGGVISA